jgi:hypothetical protein
MTPRALLAALALTGAACGGAPVASPPAGLRPGAGEAVEVARFTDARALAVDPAGRLYVVDAAEAAVLVLDTLGRRLEVGGSGGGGDRLLDPADVDPTNGLELFIADAAGGRLLRVSSDGRLLEDTPVPADVPAPGAAPAPDGLRGRPVAVAAGPGGVLYAVEAGRGVVLRWDDSSRRRLRQVGGPDAGAGALAEPVALAAHPDGRLAVADRGRGEVLLYDAFGSFLRALPGPEGARGAAWAAGADGPVLLVAGPRAVATFAADGRLLGTRAYDLGREELVDAVETRGVRWLLTPTRLVRAAR